MTLSRHKALLLGFCLTAAPAFAQSQEEIDMVSRITRNPQSKASALSFLAGLAEGKGERKKAIDKYNKILEIYKNDPGIGNKSPKYAYVLSKIALCNNKLEKKTEACASCKEAVSLVDGLTPDNSPSDGNYLLMIKQNCTAVLGKDMPAAGAPKVILPQLKCIASSDIPDLALEEKMLKEHIAKSGKQKTDPLVRARTYLYLANIYTLEKKNQEAEPLFKKAISGLEKKAGSKSPSLLTPLSNYGYMLQQAGKQKEADEILARMQRISEKKQ